MQQTIEQRSPETDNPVASFEVGIMTKNGKPVGVCIKFSMYDRSTKLTHWSPRAYAALMKAMEAYINNLGQGALIFRVQAEPSLADTFKPRHPFHTLLTEKPRITENEIGRATSKTGIDGAEFAERGLVFEIRPFHNDGSRDFIRLHEYTACSLYGYLDEYMEAAGKLMGPASGSA